MLKWTKHQQQLPQQDQQHPHQQQQQQHLKKSTCALQINSQLCKTHHNKRDARELCSHHHHVVSKRVRKEENYTKYKMPTMTTQQHNLERRLHRRSLDNHLEVAGEGRRKVKPSHVKNANKENLGINIRRTSLGNTSLTALHDISNGKSPQRSTLQEFRTPPRSYNIKRMLTEEAERARFSDNFDEEISQDLTPLSRMKFCNKIKEDSLTSSRMGDVTLDRMLDAIIESAQKEVPINKTEAHKEEKPEANNKENENDSLLVNINNSGKEDDSIHEMEVRTPQHLRRQRKVVRRKRNSEKRVKKCNVNRKQTDNEMIGLTLPNGIPSPETPIYATYTPLSQDMQHCSTPNTLQIEIPTIKRCLNFSCNSDDEAEHGAGDKLEEEDDEERNFHLNNKRFSVASSIASSTGEQLTGNAWAPVKGYLDLAIYAQRGILNVHVIRCRNLQRSTGCTSVNAYVKVALICRNQPESGFQRTAVHRHSSRPFFDHHFQFHLSQLFQVIEEIEDEDRLQLAVWHRDRQLKRSEFLGCMSFPLLTLLHQEINGSYKLQSQVCLNKPQPAIPLITANHLHGNIQLLQKQQQQEKQYTQQLLATNQNNTFTIHNLSNNISSNNNNNYNNQQQQQQQQQQLLLNMQQRNNDDDVISIDSMAQPLTSGETQPPMILSKKALHQRDADENLFLRFLELDPPTTETTLPAQGTPLAGDRRSSGSKPLGRTPFTMTKKLARTAERGFGFSIVWTHPPRVEKIEPGLSADRCGIMPGDYVIFVDKHNVVTMPEADVLNLIRSQGATLTLEIFRRSGSSAAAGMGANTGVTVATASSAAVSSTAAGTSRSYATTLPMNGKVSRIPSGTSCAASEELLTNNTNSVPNVSNIKRMGSAGGGIVGGSQPIVARPPTACSVATNSSIEAAKRRLNLPQVTFSKESISPITDNRRRFLLQLISREQNFMSALHFGMQRFVQPLQERKDLITPNDHRTLFQNIDELLRISEDILEQLCHDDQEPQMNFASRVYLSKTTAICAAYKKYCNGIKRADCVLVNKSRQTGSEFITFITEPPVPRKRADLTMFIHRPLQHFREILKLMQLLASNCHVDTEEHKNFTTVINELQAAYREITVSSGLMEPLGEGRPLLTLQDLESRMVFTKCKPFTLAVQGRQWIFGGDLSRVEGRSVKPYWTLLFSDIIVFAKVSRDRVLFITEEPVPIANIIDSCFHMRKKTTEFRLTVDPNGRLAESPTGYCAPDLTKTPKKGARRKSLVLRAPSMELKAVWQNLLQRQIFLVNAALGSTPLSSPLDSPDVLNTLVPLSDIGIASASIGSIKLSSLDSINIKNQQQQQQSQQQCPHQYQQQQQQQQNNRLNNVSDQIEKLIDEKCRILNKTGTAKSSALHLANWMKGQLDKQQEQARLEASRSTDIPTTEDEPSDQDERITYWTRQQLEKRSRELNLVQENGHHLTAGKPSFGMKRLSGVEELSISDAYSEGVSQISKSRSTTSGSQITVRSSPVVLDKLVVCRHCHTNCHQQNNSSILLVEEEDETSHNISPEGQLSCPITHKASVERSTSPLICNSLKVQHSQSSPNRCCKVNGGSNSRGSSITSVTSSTMTGERRPSDPSLSSSSKQIETHNRSGKRDFPKDDIKNDRGHLITDDVCQSAEVKTTTAIGETSQIIAKTRLSGNNAVEEIHKRITDSIHKLRILDERNEAQILMNGHCSESIMAGEDDQGKESNNFSSKEPTLAENTSHSYKFPFPQVAKELEESESLLSNQQVLTTVTLTEIATVVRAEMKSPITESGKTPQMPKPSRRSPCKTAQPPPTTPQSPQRQQSKFVPCHCPCRPSDFANTTLSPDEVEHKTCKIIEASKISPVLSSPKKKDIKKSEKYNIHAKCKCICNDDIREAAIEANETEDASEEEDLSLMLIGLAQLTPAAKLLNMKTPTAPLPTPTTTSSTDEYIENGFVPSIAVVPPTPDSLLSKTSTNLWDNSGSHISISTNLLISHIPRQVIVENITEDSCDESPLDEEPPYRPMNSGLRRYGTMSSLEKLANDEHPHQLSEYAMDNDNDDPDADADNNDIEDDEDEELMYKTRADNIELEHEIRVVTKALFNGEDEDDEDDYDMERSAKSTAWTSRASTFVAGKMSFFEESRAFIDKYLGRWNQDHSSSAAAVAATAVQNSNSETDEQMDECTSGATSGEDVWGTPTSGGDNDDLHLNNSENTQSSPTKSSNSLNDDDDTELMMDELLMAPPMTASTIRGLLPRRRLEPLFEEETESDEEKTQQESEDLKKGEITTNGRYLEDSEAGSSSAEEAANEADYDEEDEEDLTSTEDRLQPNLQMTSVGPRPLRNPTMSDHRLPPAVLKASSCEYLLEPHVPSISSKHRESETITTTITTTMMGLPTTMKATMTTTLTTSPVRLVTSTITSNVNVTTEKDRDDASYDKKMNQQQQLTATTAITSTSTTKTPMRPAKFIPPPPPPRRLLLNQTKQKANGKSSLAPIKPPRSGISADIGSSVGVAKNVAVIQPISTARGVCSIETPSKDVSSPRNMRPITSSTIIETSLLDAIGEKPVLTSSTTVSMMKPKEMSPSPRPPPPSTTNVPQMMKKQDVVVAVSKSEENVTTKADGVPALPGSGLSPRLEMRLALNHDILGDEDLICYDPGPNLTTILGRDLSTFHRLTSRELLQRTITNRIQPKETVITYSQQRNSKMDTPTVNRRATRSLQMTAATNTSPCGLATPFVGSARVGGAPQHLQPNRNTWSSSVSAVLNRDANVGSGVKCKSKEEPKLSDLEILARREKIYCMSQLKSGSLARTAMTTSTSSTMKKNNNLSNSPQAVTAMQMLTMTEGVSESTSIGPESHRIIRDETTLLETTAKGHKLFNFIKRRNSEISSSANCSQMSLNDSNASSTPQHHRISPLSPRKDNDKSSLNRRLWKHLTKRRRSNSVSEIAAS